MTEKEIRIRALRAAFPHTIPILAGFSFLGFAYGIYMAASGYNFIYSTLISIVVFGGSIQFVLVGLLVSGFDSLNALALTLMINARHLFYGISMLEKYRVPGLKRYYLIFGMCDESFSVNCTAEPPEEVDRGWFMFFVTLLNQTYWVTASLLGGLFGGLVSFNTRGLDFVMTALFVVIFLEQWLRDELHHSALIGLGASTLCLLLFGSGGFIIPAMALILLALSLLRKPLTKAGAVK